MTLCQTWATWAASSSAYPRDLAALQSQPATHRPNPVDMQVPQSNWHNTRTQIANNPNSCCTIDCYLLGVFPPWVLYTRHLARQQARSQRVSEPANRTYAVDMYAATLPPANLPATHPCKHSAHRIACSTARCPSARRRLSPHSRSRRPARSHAWHGICPCCASCACDISPVASYHQHLGSCSIAQGCMRCNLLH
jgi:hypothetical protein